jgi:hypothetical protein
MVRRLQCRQPAPGKDVRPCVFVLPAAESGVSTGYGSVTSTAVASTMSRANWPVISSWRDTRGRATANRHTRPRRSTNRASTISATPAEHRNFSRSATPTRVVPRQPTGRHGANRDAGANRDGDAHDRPIALGEAGVKQQGELRRAALEVSTTARPLWGQRHKRSALAT